MTGAEIAKKYEGCHKKLADGRIVPYICPAGYPTIGWGRLLKSMEHPAISQAEADRMFEEDWAKHEAQLLAISPILAKPEHEKRRGALTSFVYNLGAGNYKASRLRMAVDREDWEEARVQIMRWVKAGGRTLPGLVKRRAEEAALL